MILIEILQIERACQKAPWIKPMTELVSTGISIYNLYFRENEHGRQGFAGNF